MIIIIIIIKTLFQEGHTISYTIACVILWSVPYMHNRALRMLELKITTTLSADMYI